MSNESKVAHRKLYVNVMELLVAEEVERQLQRLPERVAKYIKRAEVETFALNRLPALYASSEKGLQCQYDRASRELKSAVESSVRQAFAAVQVDPIRLSQPLHLDNEEEAVLQALRELLKSPDLTWKTALSELQKLQRRRQGNLPSPGMHSSLAAAERNMTSVPSSPPNSAQRHPAWRPGTYGSRVSWRPRHQSYSNPGGGGFEDLPNTP